MSKQGFILGLDQLLRHPSEEQENIISTAWEGKVPDADCSSCVLSYPPCVSPLVSALISQPFGFTKSSCHLLDPRSPGEDGTLGVGAVPC